MADTAQKEDGPGAREEQTWCWRRMNMVLEEEGPGFGGAGGGQTWFWGREDLEERIPGAGRDWTWLCRRADLVLEKEEPSAGADRTWCWKRANSAGGG